MIKVYWDLWLFRPRRSFLWRWNQWDGTILEIGPLGFCFRVNYKHYRLIEKEQ